MPHFWWFTPHFLTSHGHFLGCGASFFDITWPFFEVIPPIFHASLPLFWFQIIIFGFAEDAHARHSSNKFDLCTRSTASFLTPNSSFGITLNITHFHPILFHITLGAPLGLALNLSCGFPFARPRLSRYLTHTGVGVSPIHVLVSYPYTQRGLTHRVFLWCSFSPPLVLLVFVVIR